MTVKDNHPTLCKKIECLFDSPALFEATLNTARTRGKGHGRIEERRIVASGDLLAGHMYIAAACRLHAARPHAALALIGLPRTE